MLLSAPEGRLHSPFERRLIAVAYGLTLLVLPLYLFADPQTAFDCDDCPDNLLISANDTVVDVLGGGLDAAALVLVIIVMVYLVGRYRRARGAERRTYGRSTSPASR